MRKKFRIVSFVIALLIVLALATGVSAGVVRPTDPALRPSLKEVYKDYFLLGTTGTFTTIVASGEYGAAAMTQ